MDPIKLEVDPPQAYMTAGGGRDAWSVAFVRLFLASWDLLCHVMVH